MTKPQSSELPVEHAVTSSIWNVSWSIPGFAARFSRKVDPLVQIIRWVKNNIQPISTARNDGIVHSTLTYCGSNEIKNNVRLGLSVYPKDTNIAWGIEECQHSSTWTNPRDEMRIIPNFRCFRWTNCHYRHCYSGQHQH